MSDETVFDIDGNEMAPYLDAEEASAAPTDSADAVIARAEQKLAAAKKAGIAVDEADYELMKLAGEEAVLEAREAKRLAAEAKTQELLQPLQERREELLRQLDEVRPKLMDTNQDSDKEIFGTISLHADQVLAELDLEIDMVQGIVPFEHLSDEKLGTVELQTTDANGVLLAHPKIADASGEVGSALREVEDARLEYDRLLAERGEGSLRTKDALATLSEVNQRAAVLRAEADRRAGDAELASIQAAEAWDRATDRAAVMDQRARDEWQKANISVEERAVELGRLSVPMSERKGQSAQWQELLDAATDEVRAERRAREIQHRLGRGELVDDDLLTQYLRGHRVIAESYNTIREVNPYQAKALDALGAFPNRPPTEAEKILAESGQTQGAEFYARLAESAEHSKRKQREAAERLGGGR